MTEERTPRLVQILTLAIELRLLTGLRVGAADAALVIGGAENTIVRDPLTDQPYIPGSSLKGKMRSLLERAHGLAQNWPISQVRIHACTTEPAYRACQVCNVFGIPVPNGARWFCQTRLRVADMFLTDDSVDELRQARTPLPFTEVKSEAAIDRISSAATPRTLERVPAGARFRGDLGLMVYEGDDVATLLDYVAQGLALVEADYLGGSGARGSGRVRVETLWLGAIDLEAGVPRAQQRWMETGLAGVEQMLARRDEIGAWLATA